MVVKGGHRGWTKGREAQREWLARRPGISVVHICTRQAVTLGMAVLCAESSDSFWGGRQAVTLIKETLIWQFPWRKLSQGHRTIFSVCSSGREEILRACMDHQERKVPMALLVVATVEMFLRMSPFYKTVSPPRECKENYPFPEDLSCLSL